MPASAATAEGFLQRGVDLFDMSDDDAIEVCDHDLESDLFAGSGAVADDDEQPFRIDDDLFLGHGPITEVAGLVPDSVDWSRHGSFWSETGEEPPGPDGAEPIIDRDDEVPERYWAPQIAGLGRRALAFLVDLALLAVVLGMFFLGAAAALRLNGIEGDMFLAAAGLQASALPFALLAAALSLSFSVFFHGSNGRTPGKVLTGIEVRRTDGEALCWSRATLRWFGMVIGAACAGVGMIWAVFEPRRRSWADLFSGTVVLRPQRGRTPGLFRR